MIDRRLMRDVGLAILLATPTLALARPQPVTVSTSPSVEPLVQNASYADRTSAERRLAIPPTR